LARSDERSVVEHKLFPLGSDYGKVSVPDSNPDLDPDHIKHSF
jgi:hypothetical protein